MDSGSKREVARSTAFLVVLAAAGASHALAQGMDPWAYGESSYDAPWYAAGAPTPAPQANPWEVRGRPFLSGRASPYYPPADGFEPWSPDFPGAPNPGNVRAGGSPQWGYWEMAPSGFRYQRAPVAGGPAVYAHGWYTPWGDFEGVMVIRGNLYETMSQFGHGRP